jgi:hypothetical protein
MKKPLVFLIALILLTTLACQIGSTTAASTPAPEYNSTDIARIVQQTLAILTPATPAVQETPLPAASDPGAATLAPTPDAPVSTTSPSARPPSLLITYTMAGDVYLWRPGGDITRLTDHGQALDVSMSPSGAWIAYTRRVDARQVDIWAVRADGSENRQLVPATDLPAAAPDSVVVPGQLGWQPGTHRLYYNTRVTYTGPGEPDNDDLRVVDADNPADHAELLSPTQGGHFLFSPDGQKLLITQGSRFRVANVDGSGARDVFTYPSIFTYSEWTYYPDPVWKKDSSGFRVVIPAQDPLARPDDPTVIWDIPLDGSSARPLLSVPAAPAYMYRPLISPDARTVLYQTRRSETELVSDLHIANIDLGGDWIIHSANQRLRNWSPDSARLSIFAGDRNEIQVGTVQGVFSGWPVGVKPMELEWADRERVIVLSGSIEAPELYLVALGSRALLIAKSTSADMEFAYTQ